MSYNRWMDYENVVHMHHEILFTYNENEIMKFTVEWIGQEKIMLICINQTQKDNLWLLDPSLQIHIDNNEWP